MFHTDDSNNVCDVEATRNILHCSEVVKARRSDLTSVRLAAAVRNQVDPKFALRVVKVSGKFILSLSEKVIL